MEEKCAVQKSMFCIDMALDRKRFGQKSVKYAFLVTDL